MTIGLWAGPLVAFVGAAGLVTAYRIDVDGGNSGVIAALSLIVLAVGGLLFATRLGRVAVRVFGGVLLASGFAVIVTHQVWYWLPSSWDPPVSLAALLVVIAGLAVLVLGYGFSLAGLAGALGLLTLAFLTLTLVPFPYVGSWERDVLRVVATASGATALTAGLAASASWLRPPRRWKAATMAVAVVGAAATVYAAFDSYSVYATAWHHAAIVVAAIAGVGVSLALGLGIVLRPSAGGSEVVPTASRPSPRPVDDVAAKQPRPAEEPRTGASPGSEPGATEQGMGTPAPHVTWPATVDFAAPASRSGIQTAALVVGLTTGLITIVKEIVAAVATILR